MNQVKAVLFDLDGTVVDSAPDLAGAANALRSARGLPPLPLSQLRPSVGSGARGMVLGALGLAIDDDGFEAAKQEFLQLYEFRLSQESQIFPRIEPLLQTLTQRQLPWGIVTNKIERYTHPLVAALGLDKRAATIVCGDTTPHAKPHPAPLLEAARRMQCLPEWCIYIGDDLRDIQAGQAAGMRTVSAAWGYLGEQVPILEWGADHIAHTPEDILTFFDL
jgi:N-acetyl-D-muramate 6-phosphate phosphatase